MMTNIENKVDKSRTRERRRVVFLSPVFSVIDKVSETCGAYKRPRRTRFVAEMKRIGRYRIGTLETLSDTVETFRNY